MGWIGSALAIARSIFDLLTGRQKRKEREEYREAGRKEEQNTNLKKDKANAAKAKKIREDVDRSDESELDDSLRKYARKPRK